MNQQKKIENPLIIFIRFPELGYFNFFSFKVNKSGDYCKIQSSRRMFMKFSLVVSGISMYKRRTFHVASPKINTWGPHSLGRPRRPR